MLTIFNQTSTSKSDQFNTLFLTEIDVKIWMKFGRLLFFFSIRWNRRQNLVDFIIDQRSRSFRSSICLPGNDACYEDFVHFVKGPTVFAASKITLEFCGRKWCPKIMYKVHKHLALANALRNRRGRGRGKFMSIGIIISFRGEKVLVFRIRVFLRRLQTESSQCNVFTNASKIVVGFAVNTMSTPFTDG